jgi:hypothetical protein
MKKELEDFLLKETEIEAKFEQKLKELEELEENLCNHRLLFKNWWLSNYGNDEIVFIKDNNSNFLEIKKPSDNIQYISVKIPQKRNLQ